MKKAARLYEVIKQGLEDSTGQLKQVANDPATLSESEKQESGLCLLEENTMTEVEKLSVRFKLRDSVILGEGKNERGGERVDSEEKYNGIVYFNERNERSKAALLTSSCEEENCASHEEGEENEAFLECVGEGEKEKIALSSVFGCRENEPLLTNWNGNFKGYLLIFPSQCPTNFEILLSRLRTC